MKINKKKKKQYNDDDGRTISRMDNVSNPNQYNIFPSFPSNEQKKARRKENKRQHEENRFDLTKEESSALMRGMFAGMMIPVLIILAGLGLFILFAVFVWF